MKNLYVIFIAPLCDCCAVAQRRGTRVLDQKQAIKAIDILCDPFCFAPISVQWVWGRGEAHSSPKQPRPDSASGSGRGFSSADYECGTKPLNCMQIIFRVETVR